MPQFTIVRPRLRIWAAMAIVAGLLLCALALLTQVTRADDAAALPLRSIVA
jgi:hypothetical protein